MDYLVTRVHHMGIACWFLHDLCEIHVEGFYDECMEPAQEPTPLLPDLPQPQIYNYEFVCF